MTVLDIMKKKWWRLFWGLVIVELMILGSLSFGKGIWFDEAYSLAMIRNSFKEMSLITAADVHPPLYYYLLKIFTEPFADKMLAARWFSILPMVLIVAVGGVKVRKLFDEMTAFLFMLCAILFGQLTFYAIEIRMYSLACMFVFFASLAAYEAYTNNAVQHWFALMIFGVCAAYTHYFAFVSICVIYGMLLIAMIVKKKKMVAYWGSCVILSVFAYMPWMKYFISQLAEKVTNEYWIAPITIKTFVEYVTTLFMTKGMGSYPIYACIAYAVLLICIVLQKDKKLKWAGLCAILVPVLTVALGVGVSILVRPVFIIRYVIPAIPTMMIFVAIALRNIRKEWLVASFLTIFVIGGSTNYAYMMRNEYAYAPIISDEFAEKYDACDSVYIVTRTAHFMGLCSYFFEDKVIYYSAEKGSDMPFRNFQNTKDFVTEDNDMLLLLVDAGENIPDELSNEYIYEYREQVVLDSSKADVYVLQRRM